jgi:hypothetical protein
MTAKVIFLTTTGAGTWTVPADWNNANNSIELIGGGAGGTGGNGGRYGGGGGAYAGLYNFSLTPGATVYLYVGAGGIGTTTNVYSQGEDTWFNKTINAAPSFFVDGALAKAGRSFGAPSYTTSVGNAIREGGTSAIGASAYGNGGGGAAGQFGYGQPGGVGTNGGGGGGGSNGLATAGLSGSGSSGGAGGAGYNGTAVYPGGLGGTNVDPPGNGLNGSGGGGAYTFGSAGQGGNGGGWVSTLGAIAGGGGGGGGNFNTTSPGGNGGLYGGGGGGANRTGVAGGNGAQGIIVITYDPDITVSLNGASATANINNVNVIGGVNVTVSETLAIGQLGNIAFNVDLNISGFEMNGFINSVGPVIWTKVITSGNGSLY